MTDFAELLLRAAAQSDVACLRLAGRDAERIGRVAGRLLKPAQEAGIAVLLDSPELAQQLDADGVHLADPGEYGSARNTLGDRRSIGIACPLERHRAMEAAESGADYVQFDFSPVAGETSLDLISWWAEVMTVPLVVACPPDAGIAAAIIAAGADFLAPDASLWSQKDPVGTLTALMRK